MGPRPAHLNLTSPRPNTAANGSNNHTNDDDEPGQPLPPPRFPNFHMDLPSPRTGEVPPALSPLDAFALQSRLLAKKFEEEAQAGRRLSRLPHQDVAKSFAARPEFFRSASGESSLGGMNDLPELVEEESRPVTRGVEGRERPKSHYPMFGRVSRVEGEGTPVGTPFFEALEQQETRAAADYFGAARAASPEPMDAKIVNIEAPSPGVPSLTNSVDSVTSSHPRTWTNSSTRSQKSDRGLFPPPKSPGFSKSPRSVQSIRSVRQDSGDDDGASANGSQAVTSSRKFSGSSVRSIPQSPFSPFMHPVHRSPSMTSEYSMNGSQPQLPRPAFNFSRPISSHGSKPSLGGTRPSIESKRSYDGRPSVDYAHRPSAASAMSNGSLLSSTTSGARSRQSSQDDETTPCADAPTPFANVLTPGDLDRAQDGYFPDASDPPKTSYTDRSFVLPRGRGFERSSTEQRQSWIHKQFTWDASEQAAQTAELKTRDPPSAPPSIRAVSPSPSEKLQQMAEQQTDTRERLGRERALSSAARSRSADPQATHDPMPKHNHSPSLTSTSTDRTIRALPLHQRAASAELTPEQHLDIGIAAHSSGALNKSTYHLRLAAKAGVPTAMLLYALACRHGWGMRPNQEDGVMWLRLAIQSSQLEVADVEASLSSTGKSDSVAAAAERKKRKAQFALAIYELGISYMNGWGCAKDKPLAVQCYEIAGAWGDGDALAEAGFCYAQGAGCKKDLKRAAALYRKAAEGGMSMAGNSWWVFSPLLQFSFVGYS